MGLNRRSFLTANAIIAGGVLLSNQTKALSAVTRKINSSFARSIGVDIFHTNDLNGQFDPLQDGVGGLDLLSKKIKDHDLSPVLVDAGNFLNINGNLEADHLFINKMNLAGYHAATIGPAELKKGQEYLAVLEGKMAFTLVNCNYSFSNVHLQRSVKPYLILNYGKYKVGITGIGPNLNTDGITFNDPQQSLDQVTNTLKNIEHCDRIICLSYLGLKNELNNLTLAASSTDVDLVVGGANAELTFGTRVLKNKSGYDVFVTQNLAGAMFFNHINFSKGYADVRCSTNGKPRNNAFNGVYTASLSSHSTLKTI